MANFLSSTEKVRCNICLTPQLKEALVELGRADNRSLNNMIFKILSDYASKRKRITM